MPQQKLNKWCAPLQGGLRFASKLVQFAFMEGVMRINHLIRWPSTFTHLTSSKYMEISDPNPYLFNRLSKLFRDVKFWNAQTRRSVETLFPSERANNQLFRTSKIFGFGAIFMKLEGFLYWSQVLETLHVYFKHICLHVRYLQACNVVLLEIRVKCH